MLLLNSLANWLLASTHAVRSFNPTLELGVRAPLGSKTVIIEMFEWTWDSIANECTNFVGPAGYGFVQGTFAISGSSTSSIIVIVSPAQEHIKGSQWWTDYQPVSYTITSKRGDRSQYQR